jgi:hypothetical protein
LWRNAIDTEVLPKGWNKPYGRLSNPASAARLLDYLIRSHQHIGRNRQADLLGGFEIDEKLKRCRLLDGKVSRFSSLQNFVPRYIAGNQFFAAKSNS